MIRHKVLLVFCLFLLSMLSCNFFNPSAPPQEYTSSDDVVSTVEVVPTDLPTEAIIPTDLPTEEEPVPTEPPLPEIVFIGHTSLALGEAADFIQTEGGFAVHINTIVPDADLLLITVNAPDGPMPGLREQLNFLEGQTLARAAILLAHDDELNDPELRQLVLLETRELLYQYADSTQVDRFEILEQSDPELITKLRAILILPPSNIEIHAPPQ